MTIYEAEKQRLRETCEHWYRCTRCHINESDCKDPETDVCKESGSGYHDFKCIDCDEEAFEDNFL